VSARWHSSLAVALAGVLLATLGVAIWIHFGEFSSQKESDGQNAATYGIQEVTESFRGPSAAGSHRYDEVATVKPPVYEGSKAQFFKLLSEYAYAGGAAAVPFLREYLDHPDWEFRCAALRALAATGSAEAVAILQDYVSEERPLEEAAQAVLALGDLPDPRLTNFLLDKYQTVTDLELQACLLETLAARPYSETVGFFQSHLASPGVDAESKATALRALGFHQSAPIEAILPHLSAGDVTIRAAAYDALAARPDHALGQMLVARLAAEIDVGARQSLYGALAFQGDLSSAELQQLALREAAVGPKIRAHRAWGASLARNPEPVHVHEFARLAIPELKRQALGHPDPGEQRAALQALAAARTTAAAEALAQISRSSPSPRLAALAAELSLAIGPP
jgi:hypothetical protein